MRLIKSIQIEGFRSIQAATLSPLTGFTSFVGKNSSGKSNVLRAYIEDMPWNMREFSLRTVDGHRIRIGQSLER